MSKIIYCTEDFLFEMQNVHPTIKINGGKYTDDLSPFDCECLICKTKWESNWKKLSKGVGCMKCNYTLRGIKKSTPNDKNRLSTLRPDLVRYFKNPKDADNYTVSSGRKTILTCPDCGQDRPMSIDKLKVYGFSCKRCGDGVSAPNKIVMELLSQLQINFDTEKMFDWSGLKRYDFYLPNYNMIIEVHGEQHFKQRGRGKSLKEEQENDALKERLTKENGIEHYIIISAIDTSWDFIKGSIESELSSCFNFDNIDWSVVFENSVHSLTVKSWEMYNKGMNKSQIAQTLNISVATIGRYLRKGDKLGKIKNMAKQGSPKKVRQYNLDGIFVNEYDSIRIAEKETGISSAQITQVCLKKFKTAGGFKWVHSIDDYIAKGGDYGSV